MKTGKLEDVVENPNLYKIKLVYNQKKKYFKLPVLNLVLIGLIYVISLFIITNIMLNLITWLFTILIGIYVLIKFKQCRELLSMLITVEVNKNKEKYDKKKKIIISNWTDWKVYLLVGINVIIISHCLAVSL